MRLRVGIALGTSAVRAIGVRGGLVEWSLEAELEDGEPLAPALTEFLRRSPASRKWPSPRITLALPPGLAQVKRVGGLPETADTRVLSAVIRESPSRFFLRYGAFLVTGGVRVEAAGVVWGTAYDGQVVADVADACRAVRMRLDAVLPTVAVVGRATQADRFVWTEGARSVDLAFGAYRKLVAARRLAETRPHPGAEPPPSPRPVEPLARLGADAWRFADAYAAAVSDTTDPLAYRPGRNRADGRIPVPTWRLTSAGVAALIAGVGALTTPGLAALRARDQAAAEIRATARPRARAAAAERDLAEATAALNELVAFDQRGRSVASFLYFLAKAMPEESAIVSVRLDSAGGQLVALTPSAAAVVAALGRVPDVTFPEIAGPVTRDASFGSASLPNVAYSPSLPVATSAMPVTPAVSSQGSPNGAALARVTVRFRFGKSTDRHRSSVSHPLNQAQ